MTGKLSTKICDIIDCDNKHLAMGLCRTHYLRKWKYGDVNHVSIERHGRTPKYLYSTYTNITTRTGNPNNSAYKDYGARGIKLYPEWVHSYTKFRQYIFSSIGERPSPTHTLDRVDNNKGYEPGNLRWANWSQQTSNTRRKKETTTGFRGVAKNKRGRKFLVRPNYYNAKIYIGYFDTAEEAAYVYDQVVMQLWGMDTPTNFCW